ncbi:AAA family ATPase [Nocardioides sp. TF02-7]|uniref:ATP-binding protein n=1 Tax=Nocardioides sp. TF02-7 TaxID=2917724 RepID=UPI001F055BDD|nr:AAA family ATPase [Nocardioides sp. TF02-7]UMG92877.1 AAA family ATPase [Nocardioides sp. TF02-7]
MDELVSAGSASAAVAHASPPRFVARAAALAELTGAVREHAPVVLVAGEAGVGKTRLLREALGEAGTADGTLWMACPPLAEPYTLGPVVDALLATDPGRVGGLPLSDLVGSLRPLFPEWSSVLPPAPEPAADAASARHRVFRALVELLTALGADRLVVDDLQWSDDVTREFLLFVATRTPRAFSLVLAYRSTEVGPDDWVPGFTARLRPGTEVVRLELSPLDPAGTAELASSMLDDQPLSQAFAQHLHEHTGGLPLAIEESVRLMVRRKDLVRRDGAWMRLPLAEIVVPPTLRDTLLEQVTRLDERATVVLRAAAVAAEPLPEPSLRHLSGLAQEDFEAGLAECVDHALLSRGPGRRVSFRHVLAGRAVYEATPELERRRLHRRTGQLLETESPPPLARLAAHFRLAGDDDRWQRYADRAVDVALETGDEATAGALLHQLVQGSTMSAERLCSVVDKVPFGSIPASVHLHDLAAALRRSLAAGEHPPAVEADLRFQLSRVLNELDEFDAALGEVERALPHLERDPATVAVSMLALAWPRGRLPKSTHLRWIERATELARRLPRHRAAPGVHGLRRRTAPPRRGARVGGCRGDPRGGRRQPRASHRDDGPHQHRRRRPPLGTSRGGRRPAGGRAAAGGRARPGAARRAGRVHPGPPRLAHRCLGRSRGEGGRPGRQRRRPTGQPARADDGPGARAARGGRDGGGHADAGGGARQRGRCRGVGDRRRTGGRPRLAPPPGRADGPGPGGDRGAGAAHARHRRLAVGDRRRASPGGGAGGGR